tara:strand:+ start:103 stop:906 length:804 start_codon:yes stop_codon:yes gene_type:complete
MIKNIKLGADPELFLERDGEIISAEGLVGGTKDKPKAISKDGHFIQEDNVMVEFNIPPSETEEQFVDGINFVKDFLVVLASLQNAVLNICASAILNKKWLNTDQAKMFGCDPDFNVWTKLVNDAPYALTQLRTAGGHIHVGYKDPSMKTSELIVQAMDAVLGIESVILDKDDRRKEMYGKAGAFRFKDYGVEYRTLSNFWIRDDASIKWAFNKTMKAIELVNSGAIHIILEKYSEEIPEIINTNNREKAIDLTLKMDKLIKNELIKK